MFSDTCTGEHYWHDCEAEFTPAGVAEAIGTKLQAPSSDEVTPCHWEVTDAGGTACFIMRLPECLVHGVCYTRFIADWAPVFEGYQ